MAVLGLICINFRGMNTGWPRTLPVLVATLEGQGIGTDLTVIAGFFFLRIQIVRNLLF